MKKDIHPDYHEITVAMTNGETFKTRSTYGKPGDTLTLDVDPTTHPAWVGGVHLKKTGQVEKFNQRFSHFGSFGGKKDEADAKNDESGAKA